MKKFANVYLTVTVIEWHLQSVIAYDMIKVYSCIVTLIQSEFQIARHILMDFYKKKNWR